MRFSPPLLLAICFLAPALLHAQELRGRVYDAENRAPIPAAEVSARLTSEDQPVHFALADSAGRFSIKLRQPGDYVLEARRLGYTTSKSQVLQVKLDELVQIEMALSVEPLVVDALRVTARSLENAYLKASGFYHRQQRGLGHFLTRTDLEKHAGIHISDALRRLPGIRLLRADGRRSDIAFTRRGGRCIPAIFMDGALSRLSGPLRAGDLVIDDMIPATEVEGLELYSGTVQAPAQYSRFAECGVIVVWTKRRI